MKLTLLFQIIDIDSGEELGCGKTGEICVKGPQVMKGYLNKPDATAATIDKDGWFHTGKANNSLCQVGKEATCQKPTLEYVHGH